MKHFFISCLLAVIYSFNALAVVELPHDNLVGCPFYHEDMYDMSPILETLKGQIATDLNHKNSCKQTSQNILSNLLPLHDFYKSLDPAVKQKLAQSMYQNALQALVTSKMNLEMSGDTTSAQYVALSNQISIIEQADFNNTIELGGLRSDQQQNSEAYYKTQLLNYTSNLINSVNTAIKTNPGCIDSVIGVEQVLGAILGGFSLASGLSVNPVVSVIGASLGVGSQLLVLLQEHKMRSAHNDLLKLKNYKTLACTYYSIKKSTCEYKRALKVSKDAKKMREFFKNQFSSGHKGEYEKFFVSRGRITPIGDVFKVVTQMGSPLTLDMRILFSYLAAKAVDLNAVGNPPSSNSPTLVIKTWLLKAKTLGVSFQEYNLQTSLPIPLGEQLEAAITDIENKKSTIEAAEVLMLANPSFQDLKRKLSSDFPNIRQHVAAMEEYLQKTNDSDLINPMHRETLEAATILLRKLKDFLDVSLLFNATSKTITGDEYDRAIIEKGALLFKELAKGSVAQLTDQSVIALANRGNDRLNWAHNVIKNAYLDRDLKLAEEERFFEFQKQRSAISEVMANYEAFTGAGTTFRNEEFSTATYTFEKSFRKQFLKSLEYSIRNKRGLDDLKGSTAAHLCALYSPSLSMISKEALLGDYQTGRFLKFCRENYKELPLNALVSDKNFTIDYENECSYFDYNRELEIQNLLSKLINF